MGTQKIYIHDKELKTVYDVKGLVLYKERIQYKCEVLNTDDLGLVFIDLDDVGDLNRSHKKQYYTTIEKIIQDGNNNS